MNKNYGLGENVIAEWPLLMQQANVITIVNEYRQPIDISQVCQDY